MGISKWIMTYSPGSVGALTRTWAKIYAEERRSVEPRMAIHSVFKRFKNAIHRTNGKNVFLDDEIVVDNGQRCITMFMFCLICEFSDEMLRAILMDRSTYEDVIDIIHSQTKKIAPHLVKFSVQDLRAESIRFVYDHYA